MEEGVLNQILELKEMGVEALLAKHKELFNDEQPTSSNPEYLRKKIAYRLQEIAHGGLSNDAKTRLDQLITVYDPVNNRLLRKMKPPGEADNKIKRDRRLPIPGSIITKVYKGTAIKIKVLEKGFEYDGKPYRTLSRVANTITGHHCNGYAFFNI